MTKQKLALVFSAALTLTAPLLAELPFANRTPDAVIDLATTQGAQLVKGEWRYSDTKIVQVDFSAPGADSQPTGEPIKTYDYEPHAGVRDFDDSKWQVIPADSLSARRSTGRLCFNWYRITITVPEKVGDFDAKGATIAFDTSLDDYAEVWVNGELPRAPGQSGGSVIAGWNALNRVVLTRNAQPGQKFQLAIFGINGPISDPPTNFIWVRLAKLNLYRDTDDQPHALPQPTEVNIKVIKSDAGLDDIIPPNPKLFKLAEDFTFTEGPIWISDGQYFLFSDPNANRIYKLDHGTLSVFREQSGYSGADIAEYTQPGSNGLTLGPQGRLTINQHGNRRIVRV